MFSARRDNLMAVGMKLLFCLLALVCLAAFVAPAVGAEAKMTVRRLDADISPHLARVAPGGAVQFMAMVAGKPCTSAKWFVDGMRGGSDALGKIDGGLYRAPAVVPVPNEVHIEARIADCDTRLMSTVLIGRANPGYKMVDRWLPDVGEGAPYELHGICLDNDGNVILTDVKLHRVDLYTPDGKHLGEIGSGPGTGAGHFDGPREAKVDAQGRIYVIDGTSNTLQRFDPDGTVVLGKVTAEEGKGDLNRPHGIHLDFERSGSLYIADVDGKRIAVFDEDCKFVRDWESVPVGTENAPHGIGVDPNGDVFVIDYNGKCHKYTANGKLLLTFPDDLWNYHAMCMDKWGNAYFAARNKAMTRFYVEKYNNHGIHIVGWEIPRVERYGKPDCLAVDDEGNVYATDDLGVDIFAPTTQADMAEWLAKVPTPAGQEGTDVITP